MQGGMLEFDLRKPAHPAAGANHKRATAELGEPPGSDGWKRPLGSLRADRDCGQTRAGPVAMGIASGDPAPRPGGVAFLFPGPASGFPLVAWWTP